MLEFKSTDSVSCGLLLIAILCVPLSMANVAKGIDVAANVMVACGAASMIFALMAFTVKKRMLLITIALCGLIVFTEGYYIGPWENMMMAVAFALSVLWAISSLISKPISLVLGVSTIVSMVIGLTGSVSTELTLLLFLATVLNIVCNAYLSVSSLISARQASSQTLEH